MKRIFQILIFIFLFASILQSKPKNTFSKSALTTNIQSEETYPFKPSDGVLVDAFPDTNSFLNKVFAIDDNGFAEFPMVGKVQVSKMTKIELIDFIKDTYKNYLRYPNVYVKPVVRISLLGGFTKPGLYYVDLNSSLWDVVYDAGGTVSEDGIYDMEWDRNNDTKSDDIAPLFEKGISLRAMGFKSGDQIWTPSPNAHTIWDTIGNIMPILTFATTVAVIYNSYQRDSIYLSR
ncbi:MAG: polysaccharide biosynthesis/export family protein [Calditrichae bacterium]|nr:polysaccharide biosynthesis/export family protein [Calditrichia bacterium]